MTLEKKISNNWMEQTEKKQVSCRKCGAKEVVRVPRGFIVKNILGFLPIKRYICEGCLTKFYKFDS